MITGFLGSGKTTLLNALLKHPGMAETAVIINEFGEIGIDHLLVEEAFEDTLLLNSGCLCCTIRGDIVDTLDRLHGQMSRGEIPPFRRAVIETTGLADPAPVLQTLMTEALVVNRFRVDGIVTTVDAANGLAQLDEYPEPVKQAAVADRIVLTKTDLVSADEVQVLKKRLRDLNPAAPIFEVLNGRIEPDKLFDAGLFDPKKKTPDVQAWLRAEAYRDEEDHANGHEKDHRRTHHDVNRHGDNIRAFCLTYEKPIPWEAFKAWLESIASVRGSDLLRMKGIVNIEGEDTPIVIHAVQHVFHPPTRLAAWPDNDHRTRIVFITRNIDREPLERTLRAFAEQAS
ncbi:MAG: GTP-binding protein [Rhodospirillales bacterium]